MSAGGLALTRVAEDYVKAIWSAEEWGGDPITAKQLATRFGITAATVSATLKRLAEQGLLTHQAYGPIALTPAGRRHALTMVRRHRLLETFLAQVLHYEWTEVHEEAEELEHAASDRLIERIAQVLGDPVADPHGDPIPSADGVLIRPAQVRLLSTAAPGAYRVARVSDADAAALARLGEVGIVPGRSLDVLGGGRDEVRVQLEATRVRLAGTDAAAVVLVPA